MHNGCRIRAQYSLDMRGIKGCDAAPWPKKSLFCLKLRAPDRNAEIPPARTARSSFGVPELEVVAGVTGLEPAASGVTGRRSNQLSYTPDASGQAARRVAGS